MKDYIQKLHKKRVFSLKDVTMMTGNLNTAKSLLASYIRRGLVCRIRTNHYAVTDIATGICGVSKYEIATAITPSAYISHHGAMEYHGYGHQLFNRMMVCSETGFRGFSFDGIDYVYHKSANDVGVYSPAMDSHVRVTDLERTVIDCIREIKYAGGLEELLHCLETIPYLEERKLRVYLCEFDSAILYKKTGFLLSLFNDRLELPTDFFDICRKCSNASVSKLTPESTEYFSEWKLYVPENIHSLMIQEGGPLV
ncbi:MAG: hypothetical protein MJZ87_03805 [Bacteroidales bacterium]|nr:hypothetical protein [Bacteroidales bacterium]